MLHQDFTLETSDGLSLFGRIRKPEKELKGVVVLIHGLGEHIGRYEHVSDVLAKSGYCLIGTDLRGHGRSRDLRDIFLVMIRFWMIFIAWFNMRAINFPACQSLSMDTAWVVH